MSRLTAGHVSHPTLSQEQLETIGSVISQNLANENMFANAKSQLGDALTRYIHENSGQFLSWMRSESLVSANALYEKIHLAHSLAEIIVAIEAIQDDGAWHLHSLMQENIVWGLVERKAISNLCGNHVDWPGFQRQLFSKTLEIARGQLVNAIPVAIPVAASQQIVSGIVDPQQPFLANLDAAILKLNNPAFHFLGEEKRRQKLAVLNAARTFAQSAEKDVIVFADTLAKNPDYAFAFTPGKTPETLRLVRELVRLYPEIRHELENRRDKIRTQKNNGSRNAAGLFQRARNAVIASQEDRSLQVLESLIVPNNSLPVTGIVVKESEKSEMICV